MMRLSQVSRSVQAFFHELVFPTKISPTTILHEGHQRTLGVALGGGFARGMVHIGVLKVLEEAGIPITAVAGTSSGSIVGAGFCSGRTAAEMAEIGSRIRFWDLARWTLERGGLCSNERLNTFLARLCPCTTFSELKIPLVVVATELANGRPAIFRSGSLSDAIRASCAYPGIFTPVSIHGVLHVDGMLSYEVPTTPLKQMGIDCVLGIHLRTQWRTPETPRHFFDVIGQCFAIAQTRMSLQWEHDADILLEADVRDFAYDDFERTPELIAIGEQVMRAALPALKAKLGIEDKKAPSAERPAAKPSAVQTPAWGAGIAHGSGALNKL
jgi:NTE family protein